MKPSDSHQNSSLNRLALMATLHCMAGCSIGEILGMIIGTTLAWSNAGTIAISIILAFISGYSLTMLPLRRSGMSLKAAVKVALAADTVSIGVMEIFDNLAMLIIPGAMAAGITSFLFWGSMAVSFLVAGVIVFPVNRWLLARGKGHAVSHSHHH